jgi:hypothetical protein
MPNWTAPFHTPRWTPEEFERAKAAYIAKYGYTITIPGLEDIIHWRTHEPLSPAEAAAWKRKDHSAFSDQRWEEIREMKSKKRERFLAMLGSPTPSVVTNAGALMTSLDDCQDALTTLSVGGRIALRLAPRIFGKLLGKGLSWLMLAAELINLAMTVGRLGLPGLAAKRTAEGTTEGGIFSKEAKLKRAARIKNPWPSIGNLLEVGQTTDQVFGYGICLGPIVGFATDFISGGVRGLMGQKLGPVKYPDHSWPEQSLISQVHKAFAFIAASGFRPSVSECLDAFGANYLSSQIYHSNTNPYFPLDVVPDLHWTEVRCPVPKNPLTLEVIEEEGLSPEKITGWPHNNKLWAPTNDIVENYHAPARSFLQSTMEEHRYDWYGWLFSNLATDTHFNTMAILEGASQVEYDYNEKSRCITCLLKAGYYPDPDQPPENLERMANMMDDLDRQNTRLTTQGFLRNIERAGVTLARL